MKKLGMLFIFLFSFLYTYSQSSQRDVVSEKARHDSIKPYRTSRVIIDGCQIGDTLWFPDGTYQVTAAAFDTSLSWLDPVISFADYTTKTCATVADSGQAYIYPTIGIKYQHIFTCDGSGWNEYTPSLGDAVTVIDSGKVFVFDGTIWIASSSSSSSYWAASGTNILNTNSGSVLIGTTSITPGYKFRVNGASQMGLVSGSAFYVGANQTLGSNSYFNLSAGATFGGIGYIKFNTNDGGASPTERVRLTSDGTLETYHYLRAGNGNDTLFVNNVFVFGGDTMTSITMDNTHTDVLYNVTTGSGAGNAITTGYSNTFNGFRAGYLTTTGDYNVAIGDSSLMLNTLGNSNVAIGSYAGYLNTASDNTFIGGASGYNCTTGIRNTALGRNSLGKLRVGNDNTFIGYNTGYGSSIAVNYSRVTLVGASAGFSIGAGANDNTFVGTFAGYYNTTGVNNTILGSHALFGNQTGGNNTVIGYRACYNNEVLGSMTGVTIIGYQAGLKNTADYTVAIGFEAGRDHTTGINSTYLGKYAGLKINGDDNTFLGYAAGFDKTSGVKNTVVGASAGQSSTSGDENTLVGYSAGISSNGSGNVLIGVSAGRQAGTNNVYIGKFAAYAGVGTENIGIGYQTSRDMTGLYNVAIGSSNLYSTTGNYNVALGHNAGRYITSGADNIVMGYRAGYTVTTGADNIHIGCRSGYGSGGGNRSKNIGIGYETLFSDTVGSNIAIGYKAGYSVISGTGNLFLGQSAGYNETGSNKLYIDNSNTATPLIHGDFSTDDATINGDLHVRSTDAFYFGDETTDGTWRIIRDGNNLVFERRESGSWVTKSSMTP